MNAIDANKEAVQIGGAYVYNDLWCAQDWLYAVADKSGLLKPDSQSIRLFFRSESEVRVVYPNGSCTLVWNQNYTSSEGHLLFLDGRIVGGTCREGEPLRMRPMVPIYDKTRNKHLLIDTVAPRPDACYQVYELIPTS